jgi:hypothetical protein
VADVEGKTARAPHLAGMAGCLILLLPEKDATEEQIFSQCMWLKTWFGDRAWVAASRWMEIDDELRLYSLEVAARRAGLPIVATASPLMHCTSRKQLQDVLTGVRVGRPVQECGYDLLSNAQQYLRGRAVLAEEFPQEWLAETVEVARQCTFSLEELRYEYPDEIVPAGATPASHLRELTYRGAAERFPQGLPSKVAAQIEHELAVIARLQYEPYFLTVEDIVRFARSRNILCQGRGSAANSAVCYCLGVTEVDPARMNVLFERFVSEERKEPPDIDIDFEHQRREEVMQYIYRKYGRDRAALTGVVTTYRSKSALRDVGKALGFPLELAEQLAKSAFGTDEEWISDACLAENGLDRTRPLVAKWIDLAEEVRGFPLHLSQHTGGFVIARDKLSRLVPVENAAMEDRSIIQWDKDDLDTLGLLKVDCLALGMLTAIHRALDLLGEKRGGAMRMQDVPAEDALTYQMIQRADTVGVFQIESRAQMTMLPRLKPTCFYDLVIQVAIVRPGPIQGGMVHPYLRRRAGEEAIEYPSEEIRAATERTLGIPLFQEQVMQIAMPAADFTPGEADQLRRAMGAWRKRGGLEPHQQKLVQRMLAKGYTQEFADRIAKQIEGFGSYGFPESHAAPDGQVKLLHLWPPKLLQAGRVGLCSDGVCCDSCDGLLQSVALALELEHRGAMHEAVEDGGAHGGVAEVFAPVLHDPVGSDDEAAAQFVALVHDGLQQLCAGLADAAREEEIVQHQKGGLDVAAQYLGLLGRAAQPVACELGVGFDVPDVVTLQGGLVGHGLGDVALAGAGLADDQRVGAFGDELQGMQLEARLTWQLRVEAPVEVGQGEALVELGMLEAPLGQARSAPVEFVLQHRSEGLQERLLRGLCLHQPGVQRLGNARQAQLAQGALDLIHGHGGKPGEVKGGRAARRSERTDRRTRRATGSADAPGSATAARLVRAWWHQWRPAHRPRASRSAS